MDRPIISTLIPPYGCAQTDTNQSVQSPDEIQQNRYKITQKKWLKL